MDYCVTNTCMCWSQLDPCEEPRTVGRPWEPGILLSNGIHFPSHKVHLDVSVRGRGGGSLVVGGTQKHSGEVAGKQREQGKRRHNPRLQSDAA